MREPAQDRRAQCEAFRRARDDLFRTHAESPIAAHLRSAWPGVQWFPYDPALRVDASVEPAAERTTFEIALAADGVLRCTRVGVAHFALAGRRANLALYWLEGYGGGLWLPFADATTGVVDVRRRTLSLRHDQGRRPRRRRASIVLDFNYAYHPSCAYDERWSCPLAPAENRLDFAVEAGERMS